MRKKFEELIEEEKPSILAFLHVTRDGRIIERAGLERIGMAQPMEFVHSSVKLIEAAGELGSRLSLGGFQTMSMVGKKDKFDLQLLLHPISSVLYGIVFTKKPSIEEKFEKLFRF